MDKSNNVDEHSRENKVDILCCIANDNWVLTKLNEDRFYENHWDRKNRAKANSKEGLPIQINPGKLVVSGSKSLRAKRNQCKLKHVDIRVIENAEHKSPKTKPSKLYLSLMPQINSVRNAVKWVQNMANHARNCQLCHQGKSFFSCQSTVANARQFVI